MADDPARAAKDLIEQALELDGAGRHDEEVALYDELVGRFGDAEDPDVRTEVCRALLYKAVTLDDAGRPGEAAGLCDAVVARAVPELPGASTDLAWVLASALNRKGHALVAQGRRDAALDAYRDVPRLVGDVEDEDVRDEVVHAHWNMIEVLSDLGRLADELAVVDDVVARFGDATDHELREAVAFALSRKAYLLARLDRLDESIAVHDEIIARGGETAEDADRVSRALYGKGTALIDLGRAEEGIQALDRLVGAFAEADEPEVRLRVTKALIWKGRRLQRDGQHAGAVAAYDAVVARGRPGDDPDHRRELVRAMADKAAVLAASQRYREALAVHDDLLARFGADDDREIQSRVTDALRAKAALLMADDRVGEAVVVAEAALGRLDRDERSASAVVQALITKGSGLVAQERFEEALEAFDAAAAIADRSAEPFVRGHGAIALNNRAVALAGMGRVEEAEAAQDAIAGRYGDTGLLAFAHYAAQLEGAAGPALRRQHATLRIQQALLLRRLDRRTEAVAVLGPLVDHLEADETMDLTDVLAGARELLREMEEDEG